MSKSWYCLDNDIILKLATCNLFDQTLIALETKYLQVKVLSTAKYKFQGLKRKNHKYNIEAALNKLESCSLLTYEDTNQDIFFELQTIEGIDAGEALLISYLVTNPKSYLLTGDKRCLRALVNSSMNMAKYLNQKVWCLEQIILKNIERYGYEVVKANIVPVRDCDTALKVVFGSGEKAISETSIEILKVYIEELRKETGDFLYCYP